MSEEFEVSVEYGGYEIKVYPDDFPYESPREFGDNFGTMLMWHRRLNLGDVKNALNYPLEYHIKTFLDGENIPYSDDWWIGRLIKEFEKHFIYIPIYAYEHGGITISAGKYSDPFDSGQIGIIFVSKRKVRKEFEKKAISPKTMNLVIDMLKQEILEYDKYLRGEYYRYVISKDGEIVESVGRFFSESEAIEDAMSLINLM